MVVLPAVRREAGVRVPAASTDPAQPDRVPARPGIHVVTPSGTEQDLDIGYYTGKFEGAEKDLATLASRSTRGGSWSGSRRQAPRRRRHEVNDYLPIEYAHTQALDPLRVRFPPGATLIVVIRRTP